ncbi:MAG: transposase [Chloroflexi bacterium]|nr:transposase [Chloroflexota bacterium]
MSADKTYLTASYLIHRADPRWLELDKMTWLSKNIYNCANYLIRQAFFIDRRAGIERNLEKRQWIKLLVYEVLYKQVRKQYPQDYRALPKRVANETVKLVIQDWTSYDAAHADWETNPHKYLGEPNIPRYKKRAEVGRCETTWEKTAVHKGVYHQTGLIGLSGCTVQLEIGEHIYERIRSVEHRDDNNPINLYDYLVEVRVVPRADAYQVELVYRVEPLVSKDLDASLVAGIDLGVNNLMAITSNKASFQPILVNGRPLKSINQFFNKRRAQLQSQLPPGQYHSQALSRLQRIRNRRIKDYLHRASKFVIETLLKNQIGTLVIGKNKNWKQRADMGKRNNQSFLSIPHSQLIAMLTYKAQLVGIRVMVVEENYTSKCSFLDGEVPQKHDVYAGQRVRRGLFRTAQGRFINADINGSYNIITKAFPNAFAEGIEDVAVHPVLQQLTVLIGAASTS